MAIDRASFLQLFPEYNEVNDEPMCQPMIDRCLRDAQIFVDAAVWGDRYEAGVFYKAAHLLAMSPFGENARLQGDRTSSVYSVVFEDMLKALPVRGVCAGASEIEALGPYWPWDCY